MSFTFSERVAARNEVAARGVAAVQKFRRALADIRGIAAEVTAMEQQYAGVLASVQAAAESPSATAADTALAADAARLLEDAEALRTVGSAAATALTGIAV